MRWTKSMSRTWVVLCFAVAALTGTRTAGAATAPTVTRMGYPQPSGAMLPLWVITEAGLDKKYGFDLQNILYIRGCAANPDAGFRRYRHRQFGRRGG